MPHLCIKGLFCHLYMPGVWPRYLLYFPFICIKRSFLPIIYLELATFSIEFAFNLHQSFISMKFLEMTMFSNLFALYMHQSTFLPFIPLTGHIFCKMCLSYGSKLFLAPSVPHSLVYLPFLFIKALFSFMPSVSHVHYCRCLVYSSKLFSVPYMP